MQIIKPVTITDAQLVSSTVPESEYPAWAGGTAYAVDARVIYQHQVYQRAVAGTSPAAPPADPGNWVLVGPSNRWAMFDRSAGTVTSSGTDLTVVLRPGLVRGLAMFDVTASSVVVTMASGGSEIYRREISLNTGIGVIDAYTYCFGEIVTKRTVLITDLLPYADATITITISGSGGASVGTCVVGSLIDLGGTRQGMQVGIIDYSIKQTNAYGVTTLVERPYADRISAPIAVPRALVSHVKRKLAEVRATPVVWIGSAVDEASLVYGTYKDWSLDLQYDQVAFGTINIEGLAQ
jgi:hypothetical protein